MESQIKKLLSDAFKHLTSQLGNVKLVYAINQQNTLLSRQLTRMYKREDRLDEHYPYYETACQLTSTSAKHSATFIRVLTAHIKEKSARLSYLKASFFKIYKTLQRALYVEYETYAQFDACSSRLANESTINSLSPSDKHRAQQEKFETRQQALSYTLVDKKAATAEARRYAEKDFEELLYQLHSFFVQLMEQDKNFYRLIGENATYYLFIERIEHIRKACKGAEYQINRRYPSVEEQECPAQPAQDFEVEQRYQSYDDASGAWNYAYQM